MVLYNMSGFEEDRECVCKVLLFVGGFSEDKVFL